MTKKIKQATYLIFILVTLALLCSCTTTANNNITVITIQDTQITDDIDDPALLEACTNWSLLKSDIKAILNMSEPISSVEKNASYYYIPCDIEGTAEKNSSTFTYVINAGATATLTSQDNTSTYYGCSDPSCEQYFLIMPDGANP